MNADELRKLVREVLREELTGRVPARAATSQSSQPQPRVETVALDSDRELSAFVRRIVELAGESRSRREMETGQLVFRLAPTRTGGSMPNTMRALSGTVPAFEHGLLSERHIEALDDDVTRIEVAGRVRFTPLALDRLRQRGIKVKRMTS